MKNQVLTPAPNNNTAAIAALSKYIDTLERASRNLSEDEFYYEFGMEPADICKLYEELERLKGNAKVQKTSNPPAKINARKLRAAVKREMINLLYPRFTKRRILKEFSSSIFADLSAFEKFFDSNYNLLPEFQSSFEDEVYRRITE